MLSDSNFKTLVDTRDRAGGYQINIKKLTLPRIDEDCHRLAILIASTANVIDIA
jgi:hypothetical protein